MLVLMDHQPFHVAATFQPKTVVDIGCGDGSMTVLLAQRFPDATIYGIDLSPVPAAANLPTNIEYVQGNFFDLVKSDKRFKPGSMNYCFSRFLISGMKDWNEYTQAVYELLAPGGWAEMHDFPSLDWYDEHGKIISDSWKWLNAIKANRNDRQVSHDGFSSMRSIMRNTGFNSVDSKIYKMPYGKDPEKPDLDMVVEYATRGMPEAFVLGLARVFPDKGKVWHDEIDADIWETLKEEKGKWYGVKVAWAQKPQ